ncbi:MAG TPA: DoxX family protein, partial [Longimicrobiales bacterium]|nr:DoxX family protein [Longimicrobiales bacterium]
MSSRAATFETLRVQGVPAALTANLSYGVPVGRALFAAIFLVAGLTHFTAGSIGYASQAGVPFASILVPFSGVMALAGGLSVLLGYHARLGAAV